MNLTATLLLATVLMSAGGPVVMGSLLDTLGNLLVPTICDLVNKDVIPSLLQDVFNLVTHGSSCTPSCIKPDDSQDNHYHFLLACDTSSLEDDAKVGYCKKNLPIAADIIRLLACTGDCSNNANGTASISALCPRPLVELSLGSLL